MRRWALLLPAILVLSVGCSRRRSEPTGPTSSATAAVTTSAQPPVPAVKPAPINNAESARSAATALLEAWKTAQNTSDADAYFALYEPKQFKGLKRTHRGTVDRFTFPAWRKDRGAMFKNAFEVAVEDPKIETWLDPKSKLKPGITSVRFLQRWRSKNYEDHGPKSLLFWRDPRDGKTRIVFEELLLARSGWAEKPPAEPPSLPAVVRATTVEEMAEALRGANLDASRAGDVSMELDASSARGLALRAVVGMGSLDCVSEIMIGYGCGEEGQDWGKAEKTRIDHPCMRRALVLPLLEGDALPRDALQAVAEPLIAVLSKKAPPERRDPELVSAVLHAIDSLPEPERLPFFAAALTTGHWDDRLAPRLAKLSAASLFTLWERSSNPTALRPLAVGVHAARLAEIQNKADLPNDVILPVVPVLAAKDRRALLRNAVSDDNCQYAMLAAAALASLGEPSALPTWKASTDAQAGMRAICLLRHDPDRERALAEFQLFFHPTRKAKWVSLHIVQNDFQNLDEEGNVIEPVEPPAAEQQVVVEARRLLGASDRHGVGTASIDEIASPAPEYLIDTGAFERPISDASDYEVLELFEENGHVYVDHLGTFSFLWHGCPC